jgi:hypothetical protein
MDNLSQLVTQEDYLCLRLNRRTASRFSASCIHRPLLLSFPASRKLVLGMGTLDLA